MQTVEIQSWDQFSTQLSVVRKRREELQTATQRGFEIPLFRGVGNSDWGLQTTLERAYPLELKREINDLPSYYKYVRRSKSSVETLTEADWGDVPELPNFEKRLSECATDGARFFWIKNAPLYRYLIYLRHHGFPSPLLDWTASPYVAAFFAFDSMPGAAQSVSIYSMLLDSMRSFGSRTPTVDILGPYIRSHRRHFIQQCQYSTCMLWDEGYQFYSHDLAFGRDGSLGVNGELIRITIPAAERTTALRDPDQMNVNSFSLFGSEDSLVRTIARREGILHSKF